MGNEQSFLYDFAAPSNSEGGLNDEPPPPYAVIVKGRKDSRPVLIRLKSRESVQQLAAALNAGSLMNARSISQISRSISRPDGSQSPAVIDNLPSFYAVSHSVSANNLPSANNVQTNDAMNESTTNQSSHTLDDVQPCRVADIAETNHNAQAEELDIETTTRC